MNQTRLLKSLAIGFIAGGAGTTALTAAMRLETRVTGPNHSQEKKEVPTEAVEKTTGVEFEDNQSASKAVHWTYGSAWGEFRVLLDALGVRGSKASLIHFAAITQGASVVSAALGIEPWPTEMPCAKLLSQTLNPLFYALVAGVVYDALNP